MNQDAVTSLYMYFCSWGYLAKYRRQIYFCGSYSMQCSVYLKKCTILVSSHTSKTECMIWTNNHLLDHCLSKFTLGKQKEVGRWVLLPIAGVGSWSVITLTHTQQNWHLFKVQRPQKAKKKSGAAWISPATLLLTAMADMYVCYQWNCDTPVVYPFLFDLCCT